jgi:hypothetical protein
VWATSIWSQHFAAHSSFRLIRCHLKKRVASRVVIVIIIKKNKQTFQHFWGVFCFFFKSSHRSVICVTLGCSLDRRFRSSFVFSPFIITTILFLSLSLSNFFFCFYFFLSFFFFCCFPKHLRLIWWNEKEEISKECRPLRVKRHDTARKRKKKDMEGRCRRRARSFFFFFRLAVVFLYSTCVCARI